MHGVINITSVPGGANNGVLKIDAKCLCLTLGSKNVAG